MANKKYKRWLLPTLIIGSVIALIDALFLEQYFYKIKHIPIGNLKSKKDILRLLLLSDLHLKKRLTSKHDKLAKQIHQLAPDIILLTGDSLDQYGHLSVLNEFLALLDRSIPKAAILGNHDHKTSATTDELRQVFARYNGLLLVNESKSYQLKGEKLVVTGLDDFIRGQSDLARAVQHIGKEKHHIGLIHSPLQQEMLREELMKINAQRAENEQVTIQYLFAGHNHGGQVTLFGLFIPYLPRKSGHYLKGWYNQEKPYLYLSKGFGTSTIPFRFWARAEITLFHYHT